MSLLEEADAALAECRRTYRGPGACYLPEYLASRVRYHQIMVKLGLLDPALAEKPPRVA
jgi:hypothetical protein